MAAQSAEAIKDIQINAATIDDSGKIHSLKNTDLEEKAQEQAARQLPAQKAV